MGTRALDALGRALDELICRPSYSPPEAPGWVVLAAYEFGPSGARFDPPVTLTTAYDPTKLPEGVAEEELILAQYNVATGEWEKLEDISVNTELHRISGKTTHFTQFAVLSPAPAPPPVVRYTLSIAVEPEGAGKVVLSPEQPAEGYEAGTRVTLTAQANPGYRFERWSGDVSGTQPSVTLTMDSAKRVVAHFAKVVVVLPEVVAVSPEPGAKDVPVDAKISATFSKPMDKASTEAAFSIQPTVTGSFSWSDNTMTFSPEGKLAYGTKYTVTISTGAKDKEGNALAQPYTWSFTTVGKPFPWIWVIIGVVVAAVIVGLAYVFLRRRSKSSQGVE